MNSFCWILAFLYNPPGGGALPSAGDDDDDDEEPGIIPGYDLSIIIMAIALDSVVIILKRQKIIEMFKK